MAVSWVSEAAAGAQLGGDPVVTKPTGLAVDDLMLATGVTTGAQTITPPGGWSTHAESISTARPLYYKIADAGDVAAADFTFVTSGVASCIVVISVYRGVSTSNPFAGTAGSVSTASTTVTIGAATPSISCYLAHIVTKLTVTTWTAPGSVGTEDWDHSVTPAVGSTAGGDEMVASGSTGTRVWTASAGAGSGLGYIVPLRQANTVVQKSMTAAVDGTPAMTRKIGHSLPETMSGTPVLSRDITALRSLTAIMDGTAETVQRQIVARPLTAIMIGAGFLVRSLTARRTTTTSMGGTGSITRKTVKSLISAMSGSVVVDRDITAFRILTATMEGSSTLTGQLGAHRTLAAVLDGTGSLDRKSIKMLVAFLDGNDVVIRKVAAFRALLATMDGTPSLSIRISRTLAVIISGSPSLARAIATKRTLTSVLEGSPTISRSLGAARTLTAIVQGIPFGFVKFPWGSIPTGGAITYVRSLFVFDD